VQAFGLSGMLTGISETVGTEVFQEFLALARVWLQKNQPLSQWAQVAGLHDSKSLKPTVIDDFTDHDDLDLEALSVRAKNLCRMEGFTAKTQIRVRSDEVLLAATKRHSATGRNQPRIVKELREASELAVAASPAGSPLTFGSDPAGRRARKVAERAPWWLKSEIRDLSDQAIRYELARQVVTGISHKKVLEALRAAAK
jgi:hypothetical protein